MKRMNTRLFVKGYKKSQSIYRRWVLKQIVTKFGFKVLSTKPSSCQMVHNTHPLPIENAPRVTLEALYSLIVWCVDSTSLTTILY
jgi:hypothetical protein